MILIALGVCKMNSNKRKVIGPHVNPSLYTKIPECLLPTLTLGTVVSCPARWAVALPRAPVAGCFSTGTGMLAAWPKCPLRAFCERTAGSELPPQGALLPSWPCRLKEPLWGTAVRGSHLCSWLSGHGGACSKGGFDDPEGLFQL